MKIIFFGLGSIGERHARLLLKNFNHKLFAFRSNRRSQPNKLGIKELYSWKDVKRLSPDVAFIANPTSLHIKTAIKCAKLGINLFIEKPIDCSTNRLDELLDLTRKKKLTTYVAYCLRFHPIIKQIRRRLASKGPMHCRIVTSSYLPKWRPNRNYGTLYSARSNKGGGVILDLSHEMDYCEYLFGEILQIQGMYGRISNLRINCEDYADIIMKFRRGIVNLHLNFFSKNLERSIKIDCANSNYIEADLIHNTLLLGKNGHRQRFQYKAGGDYIYLEQLNYFFKNLRNKRMMNNIIEASKLFRKIIAFKSKNENQR